MTTITNDSVVTLHFTIKMKDGSVADSTHNMGKPAKFVMGDGSLSENFEQCLVGLQSGENKAIELKAQDAFGMPNPDHIHYMDRTKFVGEAEVEVGTIMAFSGPDGMEIPGIITEIAGDSVTVDFNHPLAGQDVTFEVEILSVE
ncbi:FKBP-type peptidyl-prolyl cis-trans isomerase [Vibrio parahaemolyticus]|uniref:FKBP-type peptidyl-prolyl cis-trans isomerase n=1 Tax=Vibrio parahaemolyticus TaxID=670 RepID=UPI001123DF68|nr:FKBP-type peptidyl-prolyl cis-trans isomerase [Vibrio parahaemolyticus]EIV1707050.1 FKBP-type peptidyl-prolyl cis-trans isomerase [Vibrio parahaemolyticus]EJB1785337.1 FKBP-type peptidyl-prolyl cis-trans isomerase [Vibrio parahaemolyticus]EJE4704653.1 FKBP-type peptidyl-prolyl cis-trans isomerase [Vibrio parahaemolyticus]EJG2226439.1 FKBP-type peptidyl-prolyl cis-trans isomerase [Vibrio parahaemolyticus]ELI5435241.1 FKBP-type peptidyl-prolyl cis-trans isomerase [Vibrio parahaemolyticus]